MKLSCDENDRRSRCLMYRQETPRAKKTTATGERLMVIVNARSCRCKPYARCDQGLLQVVNSRVWSRRTEQDSSGLTNEPRSRGLRWHHNSMNHDHHPLGGCKYVCESRRADGKRVRPFTGRSVNNDRYAVKKCLGQRLVTLFSRPCQNCHGLDAVLGVSHEMAQASGGIAPTQ